MEKYSTVNDVAWDVVVEAWRLELTLEWRLAIVP